jgi:hypothetical protein
MEEPTCYELLLTPSRSIPLAKLRKTDLISMLTENNSIIGDKGKSYSKTLTWESNFGELNHLTAKEAHGTAMHDGLDASAGTDISTRRKIP